MADAGRDSEAHQRNFHEFLQDERFGYEDKIRDMAALGQRNLLVNLNDLREMDLLLTRRLMRRPLDYLHPLMRAVTQVAKEVDPAFAKVHAGKLVQVGFEGSFGEHHVSPRGLLSRFLSALVCVDGIVTKVSVVRPKVVRSVHYCPATQKHLTRDYRDATALDLGLEANGRPLLPTSTAYPRRDTDGNPLETEFGLCDYKDHQVVTIQEMPERAPHGQLPRSVDVYLDHNLVNLVKPGDRVGVSGVYRALAAATRGTTSGVFRTVVVANAVRQLNRDQAQLRLRPEDIALMRDLPRVCAERGEKVLDVMGRSLCPSIYGHDFIKKALVLQLLGGEEVNLDNGTHLRGDINMMIVGDPSTAKSQLLRAVMKHAPLAVSTTGRGSSGVGLTAAVTSDPETGERRLEAGAMVLADRGAVCIDEFDKMSEADRVAIHEVMEQQTVTIAKAGIHATLNARCSVTAAANPVYGQYDRNRRPQENIGLPDSLLSRFDLLFVVLDMLDPEHDRRISEHVLRGHCYRRTTDMAPEPLVTGPVLDLGDEEEADGEGAGEAEVWVRNWHARGMPGSAGSPQQMLSGIFLRKYVRYAKSRIHPALSEEAANEIADCYADLRAKQDIKTLPVTARTLETLIRLSTGHAKARLAHKVEAVDVEETMQLMNFALYHERGEEEAMAAAAESRVPQCKRARAQSTAEDDADTDEEAPVSSPETSPGERPKRMRGGLAAKERLQQAVNEVLRTTGEERIPVEAVLDVANRGAREPLSRASADAVLAQMEDENLIMYQDGEIHPI